MEAASKDPQKCSEFFALTSAKDLISIPSPVNTSSHNLPRLCKAELGRLIYFYPLLWDLCCRSCWVRSCSHRMLLQTSHMDSSYGLMVLMCQMPCSHLHCWVLMCNQVARLQQMYEGHLPSGHAYMKERSSEKLVRELTGLCSGTCTSEWHFSLLSTTHPPLPSMSTLNCSGAPAEEGQPFLTMLWCHVDLACSSDLFPITHLSLSESWQLLRKTPGRSPVTARMVTRQSFLGLRAGASPAEWQASFIGSLLWADICLPVPSLLS